ncbi:MAG: hypothetical protein P8100_12920 [bacterium]
MKSIALSLLVIALSLQTFGQFERNSYQTQKTRIKVGIVQNGEWFIIEHQDINLVLDYGLGNLQINLKNTDFATLNDKQTESNDVLNEERVYRIKGTIPINDILNQKNIEAQYFVELLLANQELGINHPVRFDLTVSSPNPSINKAKFRNFILHGTFQNHELKLPYFEGYDDNIEVWIKWTAYYVIG